MAEGWSTEGALEFCIQYLGHTGFGVLVSWHEGRLQGKGIIGEKHVRALELSVIMQSHFTILQQSTRSFALCRQVEGRIRYR
jgi:hypothetical protein